jgi:hypothetical protein
MTTFKVSKLRLHMEFSDFVEQTPTPVMLRVACGSVLRGAFTTRPPVFSIKLRNVSTVIKMDGHQYSRPDQVLLLPSPPVPLYTKCPSFAPRQDSSSDMVTRTPQYQLRLASSDERTFQEVVYRFSTCLRMCHRRRLSWPFEKDMKPSTFVIGD